EGQRQRQAGSRFRVDAGPQLRESQELPDREHAAARDRLGRAPTGERARRLRGGIAGPRRAGAGRPCPRAPARLTSRAGPHDSSGLPSAARGRTATTDACAADVRPPGAVAALPPRVLRTLRPRFHDLPGSEKNAARHWAGRLTAGTREEVPAEEMRIPRQELPRDRAIRS